MTKKSNQAIHAIVRGRVQGVFFRVFAEQCAKKLGLVGFVRNLADGTVETVAEGSEEAVEMFGHWLRTEGSPMSRVSGVDITERAASGLYWDFTTKEDEQAPN